MSDKPKITPEQLQQLQQFLQMTKGAGAAQKNDKKKNLVQRLRSITLQDVMKTLHPRNIFMNILKTMDKSVKFLDFSVAFIMNRDKSKKNVVLNNARSPVLFGVYVMVIFVFFGGIWAAVAPLDSATVAIGTLITNTKKKVINHPTGGIIKEIHVAVSDVVNQGDKLITFDDTRIKSEYESVLHQYRTTSAAEQRLIAQLNAEEKVSYPDFLMQDIDLPDVKKIIETQNNIFHSRRELKNAEKGSLKESISQHNKQIEGLNAKIKALKKDYDTNLELLNSIKKLENSGYAQRVQLLEQESKLVGVESNIAITNTEIVRTEQEITKTDIALLNLENKFVTEILSELRDMQLQNATLREKYLALYDELNRTIITTPVDGIVNHIYHNTIGSTVSPSQPIIEVHPTADSMIIEAKVDPKNIDSITTGMVAKVRFSAFKSRTTPLFTGEVISISPDIVMDQYEQSRNPMYSGHYIVRIELDMDRFEEIAKPRHLKLVPGMQAEVQIVTGTRTLLKYLLDPIIDAMFKGMKEK